jgi:hypothetical protein
MNVSVTADAEFMQLLEKEDPKRYVALQKNIRRGRPSNNEQLVMLTYSDCCAACGQPLGPVRWTVRDTSGAWCSKTCRDGVAEPETTGVARRNLRKRTKQAKTMRGLSKAAKSASAIQTF